MAILITHIAYMALSADLIMLSMSALTTTAIKNIYVLRDEYKSPNYLLINIPNFVRNLIKDVKSNWTDKLDEKRFINDFIFMCFMVGNDFLPHIPSIEIMTNGIESMLAFYTKIKNTLQITMVWVKFLVRT